MPVESQLEDLAEDHLFVCEYEGERTVAPGSDVQFWNEGLDGEFTAVRDLGAVVHSWKVTDSGPGSVAKAEQFVTDRDHLLTTSAEPQSQDTRIESDVDVTVDVPETLFTPEHLTTATKSADSARLSAEEQAQLLDDAAETATTINEHVSDRLAQRYSAWRTEQSPYPRGQDNGYDIPLESDWKQSVLSSCEPLSDEQVAVVADLGYPFSMRVKVTVE